MADINNILSNLNTGYEEVTNLIPDKRVFVDDFDVAKNEYNESVGGTAPLGNRFIALNGGKYLWVGIDGANINARNVRRYNSNFLLDETFVGPTFVDGNDGFVRDVVELPNGKLVIVGNFSNGVGRIMRLNADGSQDVSFNTGLGFDDSPFVVKLLSDGSLLVGGIFSNYNGLSVGKLVKLNSNGVLDETFTTNANISGSVFDILVDSSGKIYVAGDFSNYIVRLNADGTPDLTFDVGSGFDNRATCLGINSNGKVFVGGGFANYKGISCNSGIVRLEANGDLDSTFTTEGSGLNYYNSGVVQCLAVQSDNKVVVGGWFNQYDGNRQGHIIRLNSDGTKDYTFVTGYGFGDDGPYDGQIVQSILLNNNKIICVGSLYNYGGKALYGFAKLTTTGSLDSQKLFRYVSFGINDGYDDMYDDGNYTNTNLTQLFDDISGDNVNVLLSIPNTHSAAVDESEFEDEGKPVYEPIMDGQVVSGAGYFGDNSSYFTNYYPGMYAMVATNIDIEEFSIGGDLGSDDDTENESTTLVVLHGGATYTVFVKVSREGSGGENGDPSVNHIIIVPGESEGLTQIINEENDYDDHCIRGLTGRKSIAYLLVARETSDYIAYEDAETIALKFLDVIGGMSSTQTYNYDFSPQVVSYYGEGGLDTAIVVEGESRRSLQRTGYYELVNAEGGRKIVSVNDGETVTDEPQAWSDFPFIKSN